MTMTNPNKSRQRGHADGQETNDQHDGRNYRSERSERKAGNANGAAETLAILEALQGQGLEFAKAENVKQFTDSEVNAIREALISHCEDVVIHLRDEAPSSRSGRDLRWGSRGSFALNVTTGKWFDHEADEGGDMVALIQREMNCSFIDALHWARGYLQWDDAANAFDEAQQCNAAEMRLKSEREDVARSAMQTARARRLFDASMPVINTLGERYLRATRAIDAESWPACLCWNAQHQALVFAVTNDSGEVVAVQMIAVSEDACKNDGHWGHAGVKHSIGHIKEGFVRFLGAAEGPLLLAEGPETGLTVWAATGFSTLVALGSVTRAQPPGDRRMIVCMDDDPNDAVATKKRAEAIEAWRSEGCDIAEAHPFEVRRGNKSDFNDLAQECGLLAVRERIMIAANRSCPVMDVFAFVQSDACVALFDEWLRENAIGASEAPSVEYGADENAPYGLDRPQPKAGRAAAEAGHTPRRYPLSDLGNAKRFVDRHGANVRYVYALKTWFTWTGQYWKRDEDGEIERLAQETVEAMHLDAAKLTTDDDRTALRKWALKSQSRASLSAMVAVAQPLVALSPDALDANTMLLGVMNGTIDLETGEFRTGRREDYITKRCNVAYDPAAQCPEWIRFQAKIACGDENIVAYKRRFFGVCLTGRVTETLFLAHGDGANGKTVEGETIGAVLGDYAGAAAADLLMAPHNSGGATPQIVALKGKRLISVNETNDGDHLNEGRVKYILSNDTITARGLYEKPIEFKPTHKVLLRTNHKPKIRGTDHAMWRRIHYVPYRYSVALEEKREDFRECVLQPEAAGILNWMLAGLKEFLKGGLRPPPVVLAATKAYQDEMDVIGQWVDANWAAAPESKKEKLSMLRKSLCDWLRDEQGWVHQPSSQKLAEVFRRKGFTIKQLDGSAYVVGQRTI
ncbi:phage/plasmid primase, P4 family [Methylocystis sp. WRRC1]|uniref:phage/plasmid primase, P4 family n=1 Tax=Methylocystis sp. WRRC1 TaxID=1732014 RepID=UPI001D13D973|nr:phage/plasmid primase, P4 family [Methylocystis sp. WRRC1]MCC3245443.1 phage/plasmid primase, P4 family [Methylocystis sp. WRRC1]